MLISGINKSAQTIVVDIPLTTTSGKTRVKQRNSIFDYGLPFASRSNPFNKENYIEWQIGYDAVVPNDVNKFDKEKFKNFCNITLKDKYFIDSKSNKKTLYELSEYLYYFSVWGIISKSDLQELHDSLEQITESDLLDKHQHCQIQRTKSTPTNINNIDFHTLKVKYPQLIYKFGKHEMIAEVTIKEKQKAVGVQPMLYFCFTITKLQTEKPLLGRCADENERAKFEFNGENIEIVLEMMKIFGMLSKPHRHDTLEIIKTILKDL